MKTSKILWALFLTIIIISCAKRGNPIGGEKDITPPVLTKASPANNSINFKSKSFKLTFDEYVKLKDIQKQLIVSPPLKYPPVITPQGTASKTITIEIKDTLAPNTTYSFNFGESIEDNNEGNPFSFFKYVFSTGTYIDSLKVSGVIADAKNYNTDEFVNVMLYEVDSVYTDSVVYKKLPTYITNTLDSTTTFEISNLKAGSYKMVALKEKSSNYLFDQKTDKIGFLSEPITIPTDTTYTLKLFKEKLKYKAIKPSLVAKNNIQFAFEGNTEANIQPITKLPDSVKYRLQKDREKDTINFWFTPTKIDSILFTVTQEQLKYKDTFNLKMLSIKNTDSLKLAPNYSRVLPFLETYKINVNTPIAKFDPSKMFMIDKDSTAVTFKASLDTIKNNIIVDFKKDHDQKYALQLLPETVVDFFETPNDTITYAFSTKKIAEMGSINITVNNIKSYPCILQITDDKGKMVRETILNSSKNNYHSFNFMDPGKYLIRVIYDTNNNGIWDTGNFLENKQPETIIYRKAGVELRPNFDMEEIFTLSD